MVCVILIGLPYTMALKRKTIKKTRKTVSGPVVSNDNYISPEESSNPIPVRSDDFLSKYKTVLLVGLLGIALLAFGLYRKGYIVAATVNGQPITRSQLNQMLLNRFGDQTLELLITEKLIENEAKEKGVIVTQADIDKRIDETLKNIGQQVTLDDLLKFQGLTKDELMKQIRLQIAVERILEKGINITDAQIEKYIATNASVIQATEAADKKEEARGLILNEMIGQKIQPWFQELKAKSKIVKFVN